MSFDDGMASIPQTPDGSIPATPTTAGGSLRMSMRPRMPSLAGREPQTIAEAAAARTQQQIDYSYGERATRSKTAKPKFAAKVKLKLGEKATQGIGNSFLGPYDRELDTEDEEDQDLVFEEQFILKMPEGEDCEKLRAMVQARNVSSDVWFKFKDSRRGVFHIGNNTYTTKLVDLPAIVESQKTLDGKQMFKVADICQALVVGDRIENEDEVITSGGKAFNINDFIWPHGITPPLRYVRKRRFRKRISRAAIEVVEQEIERLLDADAMAEQVQFEVLENVDPNLSDSEFDPDLKSHKEMGDGDEFYEQMQTPSAATPALGGDDGMDFDAGEEGEGDEGSEDDLAAELERALAGDEDESGEDDEDEEDEEDETEEELDEDEDAELTQAKRLLAEEIQDLEAAVEKKVNEISSSSNPIIKRRFEDALKKLKADLEAKRTQMEALTTKPLEEEVLEAYGGDDDMDDLFADDDDDEEEEEAAAPAEPASEAPTLPEPAPGEPTEEKPEGPGPVVIQLEAS